MKLFKNSNRQYFDFDYEVGQPVEVLVDGEWKVYEVCDGKDNEIHLEPFGFDLNLQWIYNINRYKTRQTRETFDKAVAIYESDIKYRRSIINHDREKSEIAELEERIAKLDKEKQ
ncbi:MAG TPA: hypothetical protein VFT87_05585 [Candidatus Saccharimonadales bacterium]|nr:hypothetical protein [Candidatus Saccharimonadales bacterium]